jgi:hypothetical protein
MFNTIKTYKKEFQISILTGIILIFFESTIKLLGRYIINFLILISDKFSNYYYKSVAEYDISEMIYLNTLFSTFNFIIVLSALAGLLIFMNTQLKNKIKNKLKNIDKNISNEENNILHNEIKNESERLIKIKDKYSKILDSTSNKKHKFLFYYIFIMSLVFFSTIAFSLTVNIENVTFKKDLIKISPHLSDYELKVIEANWITMNNSEDYNEIKKRISEIKTKFNIK